MEIIHFATVIRLRQQIALMSQEENITTLFNIHENNSETCALHCSLSVYNILILDNVSQDIRCIRFFALKQSSFILR